MKWLKYNAQIFSVGFLWLGLESVRAIPFNVAANWMGAPNGSQVLPVGETLIATGGDVIVTFLGPTGAYYDESIFLASPGGPSVDFFQNHATKKGDTVNLGTFASGTIITFGLHVADSGETYYTGSGDGNPDGSVHAYVVDDWQGVPGLTYVGFEDMYANLPADWGYVDEVFAVQGAVGSVPDSASTALLLVVSAGGMLMWHRRALITGTIKPSLWRSIIRK